MLPVIIKLSWVTYHSLTFAKKFQRNYFTCEITKLPWQRSRSIDRGQLKYRAWRCNRRCKNLHTLQMHNLWHQSWQVFRQKNQKNANLKCEFLLYRMLINTSTENAWKYFPYFTPHPKLPPYDYPNLLFIGSGWISYLMITPVNLLAKVIIMRLKPLHIHTRAIVLGCVVESGSSLLAPPYWKTRRPWSRGWAERVTSKEQLSARDTEHPTQILH